MGFAEGFSAGSSGMGNTLRLIQDRINSDRDYGLRKAESDRAQQEFELRMAEAQRLKSKTDASDAVLAELNPNQQVYGLTAPTKSSVGLRAPAAPSYGVDNIDTGMAPPASGYNMGASQIGLSGPTEGFKAPTISASDASTLQARPTGSAIDGIIARAALARGDYNVYKDANAAMLAGQFKEGFGQRLKAFDPKNPDHADAGVKQININHKSVTLGEPDKDGFRDMSVVGADGKASFSRLSLSEQAQLYAAAGMMDTHPTEAIAVISKINGELAKAVAADNTVYEQVGKNNNTAAHYRGDLNVKNREVDMKAPYYRAEAGLAGARAGQITSEENAKSAALKAIEPYVKEAQAMSPEYRASAEGQKKLEQLALDAELAAARSSKDVGGVVRGIAGLNRANNAGAGKGAKLMRVKIGEHDALVDPANPLVPKAVYSSTGLLIPQGMTEQQVEALRINAAKVGIPFKVDLDSSDNTIKPVFLGADGKPYGTLEAAAGAKAPKTPVDMDGNPAGKPGKPAAMSGKTETKPKRSFYDQPERVTQEADRAARNKAESDRAAAEDRLVEDEALARQRQIAENFARQYGR